MNLRDLVQELGPDDPLVDFEELSDTLAIAHPRDSWADFCRKFSTHLGGNWIPSGAFATWQMGSRSYRFMSRGYYTQWIAACGILHRLGLSPQATIGKCSGALLRWITQPQYPEKGMYIAFPKALCNYQDIQPGLYPHLIQYDVSACYFNLWCKLPSLKCSLTSTGLCWHSLYQEEHDRWETVKAAISEHKLLRNGMVGAGMGSVTGMPAYHKGKLTQLKPLLGPLRPASLVTCRTAYELCHAASSETDSYYSNTDCVTCEPDRYPLAWEQIGLRVRVQAEGDAELCNTHVYRVGTKETHYYQQGSRWKDPKPRTELQGVRLQKLWLASA